MKPHKTINRQNVLTRFEALLQPDTLQRVLYLSGEAKMGKTHLLTRIFPEIARTKNMPHAILGFNAQVRVVDILYELCHKLDLGGDFAHFRAAHTDSLNRPAVEVTGLQALFSKITVRAGPEGKERDPTLQTHLTDKFMQDLRALPPHPVVFFFDALDTAPVEIQTWFFNTFLNLLTTLPHLCLVVAGRTLPQPGSGYARYCQHALLGVVSDVKEYITYCQLMQATLPEQSIRDFAHATNYKPGYFADLIANFVPGGVSYER